MVPPDDFTFVERNGSVVRSASKEGLIGAVKEYREINGHEVGDVQLEVDRQIEENADRRRGMVPPAPAFRSDNIPTPKNLRERVTNWSANRFYAAKGDVQYVTQDEADTRGATCVDCAYNVTWKVGCPPCVENNDRVLLMLNRGNRTKFGNKLKGCEYYGHDNNTACFLPEEMLKHRRQVDPVDVPCWLRELDKE